jgi:hypothetical protein
MPVTQWTFTQDLTVDSLTQTITLATDARVGALFITVDPATVLNPTTQSPVKGVVEMLRVTIKNGPMKPAILWSDSIGGRLTTMWSPVGNIVLKSGTVIEITVTNDHEFGTISGLFTVEQI